MLPPLKTQGKDTPRAGLHTRFSDETEKQQPLVASKMQGTIISPRSTGRHPVAIEDHWADILETFEGSLRTYEDHMRTVTSVDLLDTSKPLVSGSTYINPEISKNIKRVNLMTTKNRDDQDSRPSSRSGRKPPAYGTSLLDKQYIDANYPHSASSRAVNRLPLPSNLEYNIPNLILAAKKSPPATIIPNRHSGLSLEDTLTRDKDMVLSLLPQYDYQHTTIREKKDSTVSDGMKVFWSTRQVAGQRPESREGTSVCWLDRKLYLFGGQSMTKRNEVRVLNPDTWIWSILSTQYTPKGRVGHSITPYKRQLVLFGGWSHYSVRLRMRRCFKKLYILYLDGEPNWQRFRGDGRIPKSRRYHCNCSLGASLLVYGGIDTHSKVLSSLYVLDMEILRWTKIKINGGPGPRSNATFTSVFHTSLMVRSDFTVFTMPKLRMDQILTNSGFYLFGGLDGKAQPMNDLWQLGLFESGFAWHKVETTGEQPIPRSDHTTVAIAGYLVVFGGRNDFKANGSMCLGDLCMLKIETLKWEHITFGGTVPHPRWSHCAAAIGTKVLVLGGIDYAHFLPADLFSMETEPSIVNEMLKIEQEKQRQEKQILLRRLSKNFFSKFS